MKCLRVRSGLAAGLCAALLVLTRPVDAQIQAVNCLAVSPEEPVVMQVWADWWLNRDAYGSYPSFLNSAVITGSAVVPPGSYPTWCIAESVYISARTTTYSVARLFSSCSPSLNQDLQAYLPAGYPASVFVGPEVWHQINYLINHKNGAFYYNVQMALWNLIGGPPQPEDYLGAAAGYPVCDTNVIAALLADARAHAAAWQPACGDKTAVVVLMDDFPDPTAEVAQQLLIVEVPVRCPEVMVQAQTVCAGAASVFTAEASGTGPLAYQWLKNGYEIAGATTTTLVAPEAQPTDNFQAQVTDVFGTAISAPASAAINSLAPKITINQASVCGCGSTTLTATVTFDLSPAPAVTYFWQPGGETTSSITVSPTTTTTYSVTVTPLDALVCPATAQVTVTYTPSSVTLTCPPDTSVNCQGTGGKYCGATQGGWGAWPAGNNYGMLLRNHFSHVYPGNLVEVGIRGAGGFSMKFNAAAAIQAYLPAGGTPKALTANYTNPTWTEAGVFGGQVLTLQLNVDFGDQGVFTSATGSLGDLIYADAASPLNGLSVRQILVLANTALGGGPLPAGVAFSGLNDVLTQFNQAFDNCVQSSWAATHLVSPAPAASSTDPNVTGWATAADACGQPVVVNFSDALSRDSAGNTVITRTWTATGNCGIAAVPCTQTITAVHCPTVSAVCPSQTIGKVGVAFSTFLQASGGTAPYTYTLIAGGLPDGLTLRAATGEIAGTPTAAGTFAFTVLVADASGLTGTFPGQVDCSLTILALSGGNLEGCSPGFWKNNGLKYWDGGSADLSAITYRAGDKFNATFGVTAVQSGKANSVTLLQALQTGGGGLEALGRQVVAALLNAQAMNYPLSVDAVLQRYRVAVGAVACSGDCETIEALATELDRDNNLEGGLCSGVSPLTVGCPSSTASVGSAYVSALVAGGGTPGYTFVLTSGALPAGLTLDSATGAITGTPTAEGSFAFTVQVMDSIGNGGLHAATLNCSILCSLPSPWKSADIGDVKRSGSAGCDYGSYRVSGSGADIWNTKDAFHYVYQSASGDCTIVGRVTSVEPTDPWAKAGVMIRENLGDNSEHAALFATPGNGVAFQYRAATGGVSANSNIPGVQTPYWVKVQRAGNTFTASYSSNGATWTKIGSASIVMGSNVYIGLGVTSHSDGAVCHSTFDNLTAMP